MKDDHKDSSQDCVNDDSNAKDDGDPGLHKIDLSL